MRDRSCPSTPSRAEAASAGAWRATVELDLAVGGRPGSRCARVGERPFTAAFRQVPAELRVDARVLEGRASSRTSTAGPDRSVLRCTMRVRGSARSRFSGCLPRPRSVLRGASSKASPSWRRRPHRLRARLHAGERKVFTRALPGAGKELEVGAHRIDLRSADSRPRGGGRGKPSRVQRRTEEGLDVAQEAPPPPIAHVLPDRLGARGRPAGAGIGSQPPAAGPRRPRSTEPPCASSSRIRRKTGRLVPPDARAYSGVHT